MAIQLKKGQRINLKKDSGNDKLSKICIGLNWGAIEKTVEVKEGGFLGFGGTFVKRKQLVEVDLDASCALIDKAGKVLDVIYYGRLQSLDRSVIHSGDDLTGDLDGDDGLDNEIISVDLDRVNPKVEQIVFFLNSYKKQDFATVPFATIRIYEGTPSKVNNVIAKLDVANDAQYRGKIAMVMGKFYRRDGEWKFSSIGEATNDRDLEDTVTTIQQRYI